MLDGIDYIIAMHMIVPTLGIAYASCIFINIANSVIVDCSIDVDERLVCHTAATQACHPHGLTLKAHIGACVVVGREVCIEHIRRSHTYHCGMQMLTWQRRKDIRLLRRQHNC